MMAVRKIASSQLSAPDELPTYMTLLNQVLLDGFVVQDARSYFK